MSRDSGLFQCYYKRLKKEVRDWPGTGFYSLPQKDDILCRGVD
jgi:hypothetical protein